MGKPKKEINLIIWGIRNLLFIKIVTGEFNNNSHKEKGKTNKRRWSIYSSQKITFSDMIINS